MAPDNGLLANKWKLETYDHTPSRGRYAVKIRNLTLLMSIGVHAHEMRAPQRVSINVELNLDYPRGGFGTGLYRRVVCYEQLIERIKQIAAEGHVVLVETFAECIADLALTDRRVHSVSVNVEKLEIFDDCDGVGATIVKERG
tara:strand:- start:381 stop:809 length:429 start_codon:yes stop_codon:yes gene_type:complete